MPTAVRQMLVQKSAVYSTAPDASVFEALRLMADKNIGALVVLEGGRLAGIFSERDYARKIILLGRSSKDTPVRDIMTPHVFTVTPDQTAADCMTLMTEHRVRHLPVIDGDRLAGIISIGDVVRAVISEQQETISHLVEVPWAVGRDLRAAFAAIGLAIGLAIAGAAVHGAPPVATGATAANATVTAVDGIKVGHFTLTERPTGCTVILVDGPGAVGGVSQRGGAPGTRETDLLHPLNVVDQVNAIVLAGGSAFGLDAASGAVRWLDEHGIGYDVRIARVPIVPAAILFDLAVGGNPKIRPTADCGYRAAAAATSDPVAEGTVGAGLARPSASSEDAARQRATPMKSGLGSAAIRLPNGLVVGAIVAVNAVGDIVDPSTGQVVAGLLNADGTFADARKVLRSGEGFERPRGGENTTIGLVATNAKLTKDQANRMALMADDAYGRAIVPSHTMGDGDTVFALATGRWDGTADITLIGALAAEAMSDAIVRAATQATGVAGLKAVRDLRR